MTRRLLGGLPMSNNRRLHHEQKQQEAALQATGGDNDGAKRKAVMDVVQLWLDRLQLISVIVSMSAYMRRDNLHVTNA